tara:strand:- start:222 stop:1409 length:1188 start_codon:yes stop_codon:yes gene_type:complete
VSLDFKTIYAADKFTDLRAPRPRRAKYDFAVAYADPGSLPHADILESLEEALTEYGSELAIYTHLQGNTKLREYLVERLLKNRDIDVTVDDIILGNGSAENIDMVCDILLDPNDVVLTDQWVYGGTLKTLKKKFADVRGIESDEEGMIPELLEYEIKKAIDQNNKPKLLYLIPTFQNPQGFTITLARRKEILKITNKYGIPILEDDCYADNRYQGDSVTSFFNLDSEDSVIYVGSFSKIIGPGMALGYMTAPSTVLDKIMGVKRGRISDFTAMAVERYANKFLDTHIVEINHIQKMRRDAMISALGENFGTSAKWSNPDGGLYIWVEFPEGTDVQALVSKSLDQINVGFHPGTDYSPDPTKGHNFMRLCYGYNDTEDISVGISKLAEFLSKEEIL